ncbi:MAG: hypothetical protein IPP51_06505 [Bacteroidetes bacterium]|nr:hypothetical protein [Bacteroidota bacterium]
MYRNLFYCILLAGACSCASPNDKPQSIPVPDKVKMASQSEGIKLADGILASPNDTICGMAVHNEPADTLHVGDKVYGFCSTECKTAFIAELKK